MSEFLFSGAACHIAKEDDIKFAEDVKRWWDVESNGTSMVANKKIREDKPATEIVFLAVKFNGDRYNVDCSGTEIYQLCRTALRQHWDNFEF